MITMKKARKEHHRSHAIYRTEIRKHDAGPFAEPTETRVRVFDHSSPPFRHWARGRYAGVEGLSPKLREIVG